MGETLPKKSKFQRPNNKQNPNAKIQRPNKGQTKAKGQMARYWYFGVLLLFQILCSGFRISCHGLALRKFPEDSLSQKLLELPDAEASILHNSSHGERIDGISPWNSNNVLAVSHSDMSTLACNPEPCLFKRLDNLLVVYPGETGHTLPYFYVTALFISGQLLNSC